ncbi:uncharacterized protein BcabD6B2_14870 [Babesia caballi]|uniref:C3H1-type domain-containing protein n=1 Tax=Babesia caballi TaxID=5871 RepID=A0AAV4LR22_BABCB|nr:hypothetical protein BcabD6B2_14870 [Babesia caballi]
MNHNGYFAPTIRSVCLFYIIGVCALYLCLTRAIASSPPLQPDPRFTSASRWGVDERVEPYPAVRVYAYTPSGSFNPSTSSHFDSKTDIRNCYSYRPRAPSLQCVQGEAVTVSLDELVVGGSLEAPESLLNPLLAYTQEDSSGYGSVDYGLSQTIGEEISQIIDSINVRNSAEQEGGLPRRVQFTTLEVDDEAFSRGPRRCATLPERRDNLPISELSQYLLDLRSDGDVQLLLHMQGTCKPCAFYYNKRKGCRNGTSCGFCHHVDHSACSLKQWKKQQKLYSQSGSMSYDLMGEMFVPSGLPQ